MKRLAPLLAAALLAVPVTAQTLTSGLRQAYEVQYAASHGQTPLWLNANRYGLSSLRGENGYVRGCVERPLRPETDGASSVGYGADVAVTMGHDRRLVLQQLYAAVRYKHVVLTLGQRQEPMALHDAALSSGSQTLGINARPVPGIRLEVPRYYDIPGLGGWLGVRGHCFYGWLTDGQWQEDFTASQSHYARGEQLHTKAGYLRLGREDCDDDFGLRLELGLEMACQFGGTMYHTASGTVKGAAGPRAWLNAFTASGSDEVDPTYHNVGGNQLGSWVMRWTFDDEDFRLSLALDHFFEDHSSMFFLDYDGYGAGQAWDERQTNRWLVYPLKDMMTGVELELKHFAWLKGLLFEYLDTRYQSGPIYHDHNPGISDHLGGDDNYYNHYLYQGWSHWGQVMGNPLYRSPIYNTDRTLTVQDNRFCAWHVGARGSWSAASGHRLDYRTLLTWQRGLGTYQGPFLTPQRNFSLLAEATWQPGPRASEVWRHASLRLAVGMDRGALLGNNVGLQTSVILHY